MAIKASVCARSGNSEDNCVAHKIWLSTYCVDVVHQVVSEMCQKQWSQLIHLFCGRDQSANKPCSHMASPMVVPCSPSKLVCLDAIIGYLTLYCTVWRCIWMSMQLKKSFLGSHQVSPVWIFNCALSIGNHVILNNNRVFGVRKCLLLHSFKGSSWFYAR